MEFHQDGGITDNLTLAQRSLINWYRWLRHMNFWSIIIFTNLGIIPYALTTIREEEIPRCSSCCFGKESYISPKTDGSGAGVVDEYDCPGLCISIEQIEPPQIGLIPVLKVKQTRRNYHIFTIFVDQVYEVTYIHFGKAPHQTEMWKKNRRLKNMQKHSS